MNKFTVNCKQEAEEQCFIKDGILEDVSVKEEPLEACDDDLGKSERVKEEELFDDVSIKEESFDFGEPDFDAEVRGGVEDGRSTEQTSKLQNWLGSCATEHTSEDFPPQDSSKLGVINTKMEKRNTSRDWAVDQPDDISVASGGFEYVPDGSSYAPSGESPFQQEVLEYDKKFTTLETDAEEANTSNTLRDPKRIYINSNALNQQNCFYCNKLLFKIARHYVETHRSESEVQEILSYNFKHPKRKKLLEKLRLKGNFYHNINILKHGSGLFLVCRRPNQRLKSKRMESAQEYLPCVKCFGFFYKIEMWRHCRSCKYGEQEQKEANVVKEGYALLDQHLNGTVEKSKLVSIMRRDSINKVARDDQLINFFCTFLEKRRKGTKESCNKVRELGRLLIKLKERHGAGRDLESFLKPSEFDNIVEATKDISYYNTSHKKTLYTLGIRIGRSLQECCVIMKTIAIKRNDQNMKSDIEAVEALFRGEWTAEINMLLRDDLSNYKMGKKEEIPLTEDVVLLSKYINQQMLTLTQTLKENPSFESWRGLASITLLHLILFNTRREGEISKTLLANFVDRPSRSEASTHELRTSLSQTEIIIQEKLDRMKVRGKRDQSVPILLTEKAKEALNMLCETREQVGIINNPYLFVNSKGSYIRGGDALAKVIKSSNIKRPELVTSTRLRKYVATVSQIMNLDDNQIDWLASRLGHDINIHRDYYKLQNSTIEVAKVSKVLLAVDEGMAHKIAGKSLNKINEELNLEEMLNQSDFKDLRGNIEFIDTTDQEISEQNMVEDDTNEIIEDTLANKKEVSNKRKRWDPDVKKEAFNFFAENIRKKMAPKQQECLNFLKVNQVGERSWKDVKALIYNQYLSRNRKRE